MSALRFLDVGDKVEVVIERVSNSGNGIAPCPSRWCSTSELVIEGDVEAGEIVTVKITEDGSVAKATPIDPASLPADVRVQSGVEFYEQVVEAKEERRKADEEAVRSSASRPVASSKGSKTDRYEGLMRELRAKQRSKRESKADGDDDDEENWNELLKGDM